MKVTEVNDIFEWYKEWMQLFTSTQYDKKKKQKLFRWHSTWSVVMKYEEKILWMWILCILKARKRTEIFNYHILGLCYEDEKGRECLSFRFFFVSNKHKLHNFQNKHTHVHSSNQYHVAYFAFTNRLPNRACKKKKKKLIFFAPILKMSKKMKNELAKEFRYYLFVIFHHFLKIYFPSFTVT